MCPILPPPPRDQLRQAFETLAARTHELHALGFEQALAHRTWSRVIDAKARALRAQALRDTTPPAITSARRWNPQTGTWHTQQTALYTQRKP